jgi:biotin synthase
MRYTGKLLFRIVYLSCPKGGWPRHGKICRAKVIDEEEVTRFIGEGATFKEATLAFLVAVVRLAMGRDLVGNCTHEPNLLGAVTEANLFWAEVGTNPRDTESETSKVRGMDVKSCMEMFKETDFDILQGPSVIYRENKNT